MTTRRFPARRWWRTRTTRQRAWLGYLLPLAAAAMAVLAAWGWHRAEGRAAPGEGRALLLRVGVVYALSALVMVVGSRRWRLQSLGLLLSLLGEAGFLVRVIARRGPQPVAEWERDLIQALLDVGSVVLLLGLAVWLVATRAGFRNGHADPVEHAPNVVYDRRSGRDRRAGRPENRLMHPHDYTD